MSRSYLMLVLLMAAFFLPHSFHYVDFYLMYWNVYYCLLFTIVYFITFVCLYYFYSF